MAIATMCPQTFGAKPVVNFLEIFQSHPSTTVDLPVRNKVMMSIDIRAGWPNAWDRGSDDICLPRRGVDEASEFTSLR
jgi:hypothetical protein